MVSTHIFRMIAVYLMTWTVFGNTIPAEQDFGPIFRPANPTGARNILGYDNFQTTKNTKEEIKYGNHWEQFDTAEPQEFGYNGNSQNNYNQRSLYNFPKPINSNNRYNQQRY